VLAVDFDGVLCDGRPEYFEASCRAYAHFWPPSTLCRRGLREAFWRLRPVIMSGWEMPVLVRAVVSGVPERRIASAWPDVRERFVGGPERDRFVQALRRVLDDVRDAWIWREPDRWLASHRPYADLAALRRVLRATERTVVVTTKEAAFARRILSAWALDVADVQGKETGEHKCDSLRALLATSPHALLHFVEDRVETLECVVRCSERDARLASVALWLATWGYTTPAARRAVRTHPRIRPLSLATFLRGAPAWPSPSGVAAPATASGAHPRTGPTSRRL
jgi:hypothetical protein